MVKLMLLGGAMHQTPVILKAKEKGIFTILCDFLPDNPGRNVADRYYCVSTLDRERVLEVAREEQIDGIIAYASDPAARTAAYVGEALGLVTNPFQTVETLTNKVKFRAFLKANGFPTPEAYAFTEFETAVLALSTLRGTYVVKPADSSGSKGISRITSSDTPRRIREKLAAAFEVSPGGEIVVEQFVKRDGYQVAGDGFVVDGKLVFRCFGNSHFNVKGVNPFAPIAASFPSVQPDRVQAKVHATLQCMITKVGLKNGPLNFDIFVSKGDVYLMDIGPRNGGNYIPQIIEQATGVDMVSATIDLALGRPVELEMKRVTTPSSYFMLGSQVSGRFIGLTFASKGYTIVKSNLAYAIGADIPRFEGANKALGSLILRFEDVPTMLRLLDHPDKWVTLHVTPSTQRKEGLSWISSSPEQAAF
ncbi:acetyl-CoA carboxylase biotin carboxylase subunit family protein [Exiguobacterium sp. SH3S1]|uniref:ATP-grasp domain-containing protein n=1 Tax=Exiguobacterium sp. SH3S1 TaxID=2510955 RepID=UPI00103E95E9|nr:ATP-grasp domain-containing protein [Exiguobacterium sp. SH3S1]TCI64057.1 ATP-grasp domain-containing protein [Exiguobacterium sp. SH3S1]